MESNYVQTESRGRFQVRVSEEELIFSIECLETGRIDQFAMNHEKAENVLKRCLAAIMECRI